MHKRSPNISQKKRFAQDLYRLSFSASATKNVQNVFKIYLKMTPNSTNAGGLPKAMLKINIQIDAKKMHTHPIWEPTLSNIGPKWD